MNEIYVDFGKFSTDYPEVCERFMKELQDIKPNAELEEVDIFYYWSFANLEKIDELIESIKHEYTYQERYDYEIQKISVEVYIRYDDYIRGQVVSELPLSSLIASEVSRTIVTIVSYEQESIQDLDVINSIPLDIEPYEHLFKILDESSGEGEYIEFNTEIDADEPTLDSVLDKIKKSGVESLTKKERRLLDSI